MTAIALKLAEWAAIQHYAGLSADVVAGTRQRLVDYLGVCAAGAGSKTGRALGRLAVMFPASGSRPAFTPVGFRATADMNALINGTLAAALDFDDTHTETVIHPTSAAISAVLALAETVPVSGRTAMTAIAVGAEIACRVGIGAPGAFHKRGFHPTGVIGALAAAAAVARALDLDAGRTAHALGLACSMGAGIMQSWVDGTDARFIHNGHAASSGLAAAGMAAAGITGPSESLEGRYGLFATHLQGDAVLSLARITAGLGVEWESRNVALKPYPTGHVTHSFIDAVLFLLGPGGIRAGDVIGATCFAADYMLAIVGEPAAEKQAPRSASSARVSLQHILAEAVVFGEIGAQSFAEDRLNDPAVRQLAANIVCEVDHDVGGRGRYKGWVRLHLRDGTHVDRVEDYNWGSREKPMSDIDVRHKAAKNLEGSLDPAQAAIAIDNFAALDRFVDLADAIPTFGRPKP